MYLKNLDNNLAMYTWQPPVPEPKKGKIKQMIGHSQVCVPSRNLIDE